MASRYSSNSSKEYKIALIGETGAGKTSFLELILNYALQTDGGQFDLAKVSQQLSKSSLSKSKKKKWYSATTESESYKAEFGAFHLHIIDTPGFNDTGGREIGKNNIANIIKHVRKEKYLNCICLIINGSSCRLTFAMKGLIQQIVSILPPRVLDNIICVCTYARNKWRASFDFQVLEEFNLMIPRERRFYLDNPLAVYKKTLAPEAEAVDEVDKEDFMGEFTAARRVAEKMFGVIKAFGSMETGDFGIFREVCEDIRLSFANVKLHHVNREALDEKIQKILSQGSGKVKVSYSEKVLKEATRRSIYCTDCVSNCHLDCECFFAFLFKNACRIVTKGTHVCKKCGHHSSRHNRTKHFYETSKVDIIFEGQDERVIACQEKIQAYQAAILAETNDLKSKLKTFQCIGSHFAVSEIAKIEIDVFKEDNERIKGYIHQEEINQILDSTYNVIDNPYEVQSCDTKFRWACGMLGADPDKFSKESISILYQQLSKAVQPDSTRDAEEKSKQLHHAKEYLETY